MYFVVGLVWTQKLYDSIWVVVDRLNKSTHFIPIMSTYLVEDYVRIFIDEIVCSRCIWLRDRILEEAYKSRYSIHSGSTKIYHDLREIYWWEGMKKDIQKFVARCPNCQQVKVEHQKSSGLLHEIQVPT